MNEAKEKAVELLYKLTKTHIVAVANSKGILIKPYTTRYAELHIRSKRAKQCAIIAVDLVIDDILNGWCANAPNILETIKFWQQVKIEIEKL